MSKLDTLKKWTKVPLHKAINISKDEYEMFVHSNAIRFLPIFIAYGVTVILLLKLAKYILV